MVAITMIFCLSNSSQGGKLFSIRKFFPNFAILPKSHLLPTVSRDLVSLPIVRGWETFSKNGKLLSHFEKVSHPLNPCGCKAQRHRWETGKLFFKIIFESHNKL